MTQRDEWARIIDPEAGWDNPVKTTWHPGASANGAYRTLDDGQTLRDFMEGPMGVALAKADALLALQAATPGGGELGSSYAAQLSKGPTALDPERPSPAGPLTVETAAIRIGDAVFTLPRPNRHHNIMWWLSVLGIQSGQMHDQGFVLNDGRYVDRATAVYIAWMARQLSAPSKSSELFSEDLWDGGADMVRPDILKALAAAPPATPTAADGEQS